MQPSNTTATDDPTPSIWSTTAEPSASPGTPAPPARTSSKTPKKLRAGVLRCPSVPEHGILRVSERGRLWCPHQDHDGRPSSHPLGAAAPTPCYFTLDAAEAANTEED